MNIHNIRPHIQAVIPKGDVVAQVGSNSGLIHTDEGIILIDTSISVKRMGKILGAAGVRADDVCLVINTHLHADHINGNSLFKGPVICHSKGKGRMAKKCAKTGQSLTTFDVVHEAEIGSIHLQMFHTGGHTPDSIVIWLPEDKVLFSGDLIFSGRAPFLASVTNFKALTKALRWLGSFGAEVIVPGHGLLCDEHEIQAQLTYLETTWEIIKGHVDVGHSMAVIRNDPNLSEMTGKNYERNIEWIYKRLKK